MGLDSLRGLFESDASIKAAFSETLCIRTGNGGIHFKFTNPDGFDFANAVAAWPGIDLRVGGKGYCIVPPSPGYTVHSAKPRQRVPSGLWREYEAKKRKVPQPTASTPGTIPEGQRDDTLFRLACKMRRDGYDADAIAGALLKTNERCQPPLPEAQVMAKVGSAMRYNDASDDEAPMVESLESIEMERFTYILKPFVALQEVTLLTGDGGQGKGILTCLLAALVSNGKMSELGESDLTEAGNGAVLQP